MYYGYIRGAGKRFLVMWQSQSCGKKVTSSGGKDLRLRECEGGTPKNADCNALRYSSKTTEDVTVKKTKIFEVNVEFTALPHAVLKFTTSVHFVRPHGATSQEITWQSCLTKLNSPKTANK
jgi:hypothetical protein